jgi:hypothetical protein
MPLFVYFYFQGYNNDFLCQTEHEIALTYNNNAPLENFHCANVFLIMRYIDMHGNIEQNALIGIKEMVEKRRSNSVASDLSIEWKGNEGKGGEEKGKEDGGNNIGKKKKNFCDIFRSLSADDRRKVRRVIIDMILATDMKQHFPVRYDDFFPKTSLFFCFKVSGGTESADIKNSSFSPLGWFLLFLYQLMIDHLYIYLFFFFVFS